MENSNKIPSLAQYPSFDVSYVKIGAILLPNKLITGKQKTKKSTANRAM